MSLPKRLPFLSVYVITRRASSTIYMCHSTKIKRNKKKTEENGEQRKQTQHEYNISLFLVLK